MKPTRLLLALLAAIALLAGCKDPALKDFANQANSRAKKEQDYKSRKIRVPDNFPRTKTGTGKSQKAAQASPESRDVITRAYDATQRVARSTGRPEQVAVNQVAAALRASLELGPTLIVWVIDRTPSAQKIVTEATAAARSLYDSEDIRALSHGGGQTLLTSVIAFDDRAESLLDPPSGDWQAAQAALDKLQPSTGGRENTFAAIRLAFDKALPLRTAADNRREVLIMVITDEAGDDGNLVDDLAALARRHAIPVYCLGSPAPWGQVNPLAADPKKGDPAKTDDSVPRYGPESLVSERVDLEMVGVTATYGAARNENLQLIDSGVGPFALERLCRAGGGQFFAIRPEPGSQYSFGGQGYSFWPSGSELRFEPAKVAKYAPDYISAAEHNRLIAENKARQALVTAAALPGLVIEDYPDLRFPKANEAQQKRNLDKAQQFAARHAPAVDKFYDALLPGEADRERLVSPRLQAEFDLAFGRVLAIKARIDGYNSMLAALKRGKPFTSATSTEWVLEPADAFETESSIKKLAERARLYLERVAKEHAGTPWAKIAEHELRAPLGWTWKES